MRIFLNNVAVRMVRDLVASATRTTPVLTLSQNATVFGMIFGPSCEAGLRVPKSCLKKKHGSEACA
jgi:hypothetical protein